MSPDGFAFRGRVVRRAGVIGSGQIGPDIALHLVRTLSPRGVRVVVVDVSEPALAAGRAKLEAKIERGRATGAFTGDFARRMLGSIEFTTDYDRLAGAGLVIEAASENLAVKRRIFADVERLAAPDAALLSNSSHLEPERIFANVARPERTGVAHYFFPAERNPVVEIVGTGGPGSGRMTAWLLAFYEELGKAPVAVRSRFGHALNPIFEGLFLAAALAVEEGLGTTREVDDVARRALRLGIGPFTAMNLTGGNPITHEGFGEMHVRLHPWFRVPRLLEEAMEEGGPTGRRWDVPERNEAVAVPEERRRAISERMSGAYMGLSVWTLESGAISLSDLDMACHLALAAVRPFGMMNELGGERSAAFVARYREREPTFFDAGYLTRRRAAARPWSVPRVLVSEASAGDGERVAVLKIRRPEVLNALDEEVFEELDAGFGSIAEDPDVAGVVLTGFGVKAFVSGADVRMLDRIRSAREGEALSRASHRVLDRIAAFPKPVVCAMNGMAVGGGAELAMACRARIARAGLPVLAMQPEVNLGIIPGAGATQRLPRLIGLREAWRLLRSGAPASSEEALRLGLVTELVPGPELERRAVELAAAAASGDATFPETPGGPIRQSGEEASEDLPDIDIGHRSRAVDELLRRAVIEGAALPLADGLRLESRLFGQGCALEDMRIGVRNFLENGPASKAAFVHR